MLSCEQRNGYHDWRTQRDIRLPDQCASCGALRPNEEQHTMTDHTDDQLTEVHPIPIKPPVTDTSDDIGDTRYAEELTGNLLTDSQDLDAVREHLGEAQDDMTGAIVTAIEGDYASVWITDDSAPYANHARYIRVR